MNNFPDGLLWFPDSLSGKGKQASGVFPAAWDFFPRSQFVMDEAGAIQYKDKMHIDWLNDFLEWTPILLMVLVAVTSCALFYLAALALFCATSEAIRPSMPLLLISWANCCL